MWYCLYLNLFKSINLIKMITVGNLILDLTAAALLPTFFWHLFMVSAEL